jgi:DNA-binding MarR family transcriptional regulator
MADISKFINDPVARKERVEEKRKTILEFISAETFTTTEVVAELLKISRQAALKTLKAMEKDELVKMHDLEFSLAQKGKQVIWGVTPKGALLAADLDDFRVDYYEVGRISVMTIPHSLAVQRARVFGLAKGFTEWKSSRKMRQLAEKDRGVWLQVPDAVAKNESGELVAFEVERTVKTPKRYNEILSNYAQMFLDRTLSEVFYICPDELKNRLEKLFLSIEKMVVSGQTQPVHPKVREKIKFFSVSEWEVR